MSLTGGLPQGMSSPRRLNQDLNRLCLDGGKIQSIRCRKLYVCLVVFECFIIIIISVMKNVWPLKG